MPVLSEDQLCKFHSEGNSDSDAGFLIIEDFLSAEQVQALSNEAARIVSDLDISAHPMTRFIANNKNHINDTYFIESSDKERCFFEEDAIKDGKLVVEKASSVNKIGHGLHLVNPVFRKCTYTAKIRQVVDRLGFTDPIVLQSMVIFKNPRIGGEVQPHQDSTFLYTDPNTTIGLWFPMHDCTPENGTLSFIPKSHIALGKITKRFVRRNGTLVFEGESAPFNHSDFVTVNIKKGSLVLIHGSVVHASGKNLSPNPRNAYTFHVIDGKSQYPEDNWLQIPGGFEKFQ